MDKKLSPVHFLLTLLVLSITIAACGPASAEPDVTVPAPRSLTKTPVADTPIPIIIPPLDNKLIPEFAELLPKSGDTCNWDLEYISGYTFDWNAVAIIVEKTDNEEKISEYSHDQKGDLTLASNQKAFACDSLDIAHEIGIEFATYEKSLNPVLNVIGPAGELASPYCRTKEKPFLDPQMEDWVVFRKILDKRVIYGVGLFSWYKDKIENGEFQGDLKQTWACNYEFYGWLYTDRLAMIEKKENPDRTVISSFREVK